MKRNTFVLALVSAAFFAWSCGTTVGGDDSTINDVSADNGVDSAVVDNGRPDNGTPDQGGLDTGSDIGVDIVPEIPEDIVEDIPIECPGSAGCTCTTNSECYSGFCVETSGKRVCASGCTDETSCPRGWKCSQVTAAGDTAFICIDPFSRLCRPCVEDTDCVPSVGAGSEVFDCLSYGPDGAYCSKGCVVEADCPEGYACSPNPAGSGNRCIQESGVCECTEIYISQGYLTECYVENDIGKCYGSRTCDGVCDAPEPVAETCNNFDDDCDGQTDEGLAGAACNNTNEYGSCPGTLVCSNGNPTCNGRTPAPETCNGIDDDCDSSTDESASNCLTFYKDNDHDSFGVTTDWRCLCQAAEGYSATAPGDCNDNDVNVYPGLPESCNGKDDNCNGQTDELGALNCQNYYKDADQDSYGVDTDKKCLCEGSGTYTAIRGGDCNDTTNSISPGVTESCNGKDDDCDGKTDEEGADGCTEWFKDVDADTFGDVNNHKCLCASTSEFKVSTGYDCNDSNMFINPGVMETCNAIDDNCDGRTDEEGADQCSSYYFDNDGDNYGVGTPKCLCGGSGKYTATNTGDCLDTDGGVNPGATEVCNSKDDNCNGTTDEPGSSGCNTYYLDTDRDTYGVSNQYACLCQSQGDFRATRGGDCNDADENVYPSKIESCNGIDDDCDNAVDEDNASGCTDYYMDLDRDTFGDVTKRRCMCQKIEGTYDATSASDCCDSDANAFPGQTAYFPSPSQCGSYDYNCSGAAEKQWTTTGGGCDGWNIGSGCGRNVGWVGSVVPNCGVTAQWVHGGCGYASIPLSCDDPEKRDQVQACR